MNIKPITENDLHAYVDGLGPESRRAEIEAHLAGHPEDAQRVRAYELQAKALHEAYDRVLKEPIPLTLQQLAARPYHPDAKFLSRWSLQRIAASVVLAVFSGVLGWALHGQFQRNERLAQSVPLSRQAAIAHVVFSPDVKRPVEIGADHEDQLVTWLSKRLGTAVRPPKLGPQGFELVGGRLLPGNKGPVAQFMYQDVTGQRLSLMVSTEIADNHDTAFRFSQEDGVNVFYWIDGKFGYALSAGIAKGDLGRVATAVYDQFDRKQELRN
jgi:anti-sigma factor RsiW